MDCERCGIKDAVFYQTIALACGLVIMVFNNWKIIKEHRSKELLITFIPATIIGTPTGNILQEYLPSDIVKVICGVLICIALGNSLRNLIPETQLYKKYVLKEDIEADDTVKPVQEANHNEEKQASDAEANVEGEGDNAEPSEDDDIEQGQEEDKVEEPKKEASDSLDVSVMKNCNMKIYSFIAGFLSGFLGGLAGIRGPPLMVFFLIFPFPKNIVRANSIIILIVNIVMRVVFYIIQDVSGQREMSWFQSDLWYLYVCVALFGVLGVPIGSYIANRINQNQFKLVIALMLFLSGISNLVKGSIEVAQS